MVANVKRDALFPWYIGLAIIATAVGFFGYQFYSNSCQAPVIAQLLFLIAVPAVYLVLMYLTFKSQD